MNEEIITKQLFVPSGLIGAILFIVVIVSMGVIAAVWDYKKSKLKQEYKKNRK